MRIRSRLYTRILRYFLTIAVLVIVTSAVVGAIFVRRNEAYFDRQIAANMAAINDRISTYFQRIYNACTLFSLEMNAGGYLRDPADSDAEARLGYVQVRDALEEMQITLDDAAHSVFVYGSDGRVYTNEGVSDMTVFFRQFSAYDSYDIDFWRGQLNEGPGTSILPMDYLSSHHTARRLMVAPIVFRWYSGPRLRVIVVNLRVDDIRSMFHDTAVFGESRFVVVQGNGGAIYPENAIDASSVAALSERAVVRLPGDRRTRVAVEHNDVLGWSIVCLTPASAFFRTDAWYLALSVALSAALASVAIAFARGFARRVYSPIRTISDSMGELIGDSGGDDRELVNELDHISIAVHDIWNKKRLYEARSKYYSAEFIRQSLRDVLENRPLPDGVYLENILRREFSIRGELFQCVAVAANRRDEAGTPTVAPRSVLEALGAAGRSGTTAFVCHVDLNLYLLIFGVDDDGACVREAAGRTLSAIGIPNDTVLRAGVGGAYRGAQGLADTVTEACGAVMLIGRCEAHAVRVYAGAQSRRNQEEIGRCHATLGEAIRSRNTDAIREAVEKSLLAGVHEGDEYHFACGVVQAVCDIGADHVRQWGLAPGASAAAATTFTGFPETLVRRPNLDEAPIVDYIERLMRRVDASDQTSNPLTLRVKRFIDMNYPDVLSLDLIGDAIGVSGKHISRVFKNEMHMNVTDYLAFVRVRETKRLLADGLTLDAIAARVGLPSRTSFVRTFKKIEGVSPSAYRRLIVPVPR